MDKKTLPEIPIELQEQLRRGNVLLFLGEGINHGPDGVPDFPSLDDLAAELASRCDYPEDAPLTLSQVAQFYEDSGPSRQSLLTILKDRLDRPDFAPGKNHRQIVTLPVKAIVTTCYDDLMEQALRAASPPRPYTLVVGRVDTAFLVEEKTTLVKLWGDLSQPESLVVTEDDRRTFLRDRQSMAYFLSSELIRRTWVFLGYDLADPWFKDFFDTVRQSVQGFDKRAFVLGTKAPTHVISWWQKRNVAVLEAEIAKTLSALVDAAIETRLITPVNPYKLLESFSGVDRNVFAGRDKEIVELLRRVERQSLIVLFGESGTGKTSLVNAGFVPRLRDEGWMVVSVRCLDEPVHLIRREALLVVQQASGLTTEQLKGDVGALGATADLAEFMHRLGHYLTSERRRLVIIVDQFEEIFARAGELQRQQLARAVKAIQELPELCGRLVILFALREDYLGQLWSWAHDYDLGAAWYNAFRITRLTDAQARQAIVEPASKSGAVFEPDLIDQVLHGLRDIGDGLVYPPYLQVVCFALFERGLRDKDNTTIYVGVAGYETLGKAERIISDYLDTSLFEGLTPVYQRIAEGVLDALTGARGLRTLMSFEEISRAVGDDPDRVRDVIEVLVRRRVVRPYWDKERLRGYELVHDFLSRRFFERLDPARQQQKLAVQLYRQAVSDWKALRLPIDHSRLDMFLRHADILFFDEAGYRMVLEAAAPDVNRFDKWAEAVARRADEESVSALIERLEDPQWRVRMSTIKALGGMGESASQAVEPLAKRLVTDKTWEVREAAAQALGDIGEVASPAVDALLRSLEDHTRHVRRAAAQALGKMGEPKAAESLATRLDDHEEVRQAVVNALASIGTAAVDPLIPQLASTKVSVRLAAVQALEDIGPEAAPAAEALVAKLGDKKIIHKAAMRALTKIGAMAVGPLVGGLNGNLDEQIRLAVIEILSSIGSKAKLATEPLVGVLGDESGTVRLAAMRALGQILGMSTLVRLGDENKEVRRAAAKELGTEMFAQAAEPILAALRDEDWEVRRTIAQLLGQARDARAVESLIIMLMRDSDWRVRQAAAHALEQIGDKRAVESLIFMLKDSDRRVCQAAAQALGQIGDKRAIEPLIAALGDDSSRRGLELLLCKVGPRKIQVIKTVRHLTELGLKEAKEMVDNVPTVVGRDLDVREAMRIQKELEEEGAVVEIRGPITLQAVVQALGELRDERAVEPLIAILEEIYPDVRQAAAQALGQIGDKRAAEPLITALEDSAPGVRQAAAQALGQLGDKRAVERLIIRRLWDSDWRVRQAAVQVLDQLRDEQAAEPFIAVLGDLSAVREVGVVLREIGLKKIQVIKAVREITSMGLRESKELVDSAPTVVVKGVSKEEAEVIKAKLEAEGSVVEVRGDIMYQPTGQALRELVGEQQAIKLLTTALEDREPGVRRAAAQALGQPGDERALEPLTAAALGDSDSGVRQAAAQALGQIGEPSVEPLIAALGDSDSSDVRRAAAQALGQIGDKRAMGPLISTLGDKNWSVRHAAAQGLRQIGHEQAMEPLIAALGDSDSSDVRRAAAQALGQIGDEQAMEPLIAALGDSDSDVRHAAAQALKAIGGPEAEAALHK